MNDLLAAVRECLHSGEPAVLATVVNISPASATSSNDGAAYPLDVGAKLIVRPGSATQGSFGESALDEAVVGDALAALDAGQNLLLDYPPGHAVSRGDVTVFFEVFTPPPRMVVIGATDFTAQLVRAAKAVGYRVDVCDPRAAFATAVRFPEADDVVVDWPDRYLTKVAHHLGPLDAVCVLSHDHKFDVPAILAALDTRVGYIGAMGSRRTQAERAELLRNAGANDAGLARVMGPIGLDIGARSPEETAIAILAEIIALRTSSRVPSLRDGTGPIHGAHR
jgi:xanthine dehydrogenase accessory factor